MLANRYPSLVEQSTAELSPNVLLPLAREATALSARPRRRREDPNAENSAQETQTFSPHELSMLGEA